jgi:hypothetical protein
MCFACVRDDECFGLGFFPVFFFTVNLTAKLFDRFGPTSQRTFYTKIGQALMFYKTQLKKIFEPKVKRRRNGAEKNDIKCFVIATRHTVTYIDPVNE